MKKLSVIQAFLIFAIAFLLIVVSQWASQFVFLMPLFNESADLAFEISSLIIFMILYSILLKVLGTNHLLNRQLYLPRFQIEWLILAILLPLVLLGATYFLVPGEWEIGWQRDQSVFYQILYLLFVDFIGGALQEELVFRGIGLDLFSASLDKWLGILLPATLFSTMHLINKPLDNQSMILLLVSGFLVSVMFSLIAYVEESVWASSLCHILLNGIPSVIYFVNPSVETELSYAPIYYLMRSNNPYLTGGEYSLLTSGTAIILYLIVIYYFYRRGIRKKRF
ncbi:CPBP family intramembrane glutamic endopeptidase [Hutsoniella sourekii]